MNIEFDKKGTKNFFDWLAKQLLDKMLPTLLKLMAEYLEDDELLTRKEVSERILKCSTDAADKNFLNKKDFPWVPFGNGKRYPKKAVQQWIKDNTVTY